MTVTDLTEDPGAAPAGPADPAAALVERIRRGVVGDNQVLEGPYGPRRIVYADWTASGRALDFVEDAIRDRVLPWYANTHTESSGTGRRTTRLREQARQVIHQAVGGTDQDLVIFAGSGATAAVAKLTGLLQLGRPAGPAGPAGTRPVVFVGPFEHHSNLLPWRESAAEVVAIGEDRNGQVDLAGLEAELARHAGRPLLVGAFSAASNVTGIISDVDGIAALLHRHGALSVWDYSAAAPYLPIRMGESAPGAGDHKDAVFFSPHKFVGGPQTPGVLVVRRDLARNQVPTVPGGGTVAFVDPVGQRYLDDPVAREEGGTPGIVESVRAGLVVALKQAVGTDLIQAREQRLLHRALARWHRNPNLELLGNLEVPRLPIVSFRIRHGTRHLHHELVVAMLNDLFGIQARGGCSCAGPYGHRLLGIDPDRSRALNDQAGQGWMGIKPGWVRLSFNYFIDDEVAGFLVEAVDLLATSGHRLLGDYRFDPRSGHWRHRDAPPDPVLSLADLLDGWSGPGPVSGGDDLAGHLERARVLLGAAGPLPPEAGPSWLPPELERLRDFHLPTTVWSRPSADGQ
ncbi:MAG TPA: aminotransferase class V-fold PLP-dependent enzyme [Actinomycetota bacterium]|nr:aminotransferase class V-fold PLP-dependent enzyme [Actinomycetota bacterium]